MLGGGPRGMALAWEGRKGVREEERGERKGVRGKG